MYLVDSSPCAGVVLDLEGETVLLLSAESWRPTASEVLWHPQPKGFELRGPLDVNGLRTVGHDLDDAVTVLAVSADLVDLAIDLDHAANSAEAVEGDVVAVERSSGVGGEYRVGGRVRIGHDELTFFWIGTSETLI